MSYFTISLQIYKKIYDLVYANYTAYVQVKEGGEERRGRGGGREGERRKMGHIIIYLQELENVTALEISLQEAARTCVNSRRYENEGMRMRVWE